MAQTTVQKVFTAALSFISEHSKTAQNFIKNNTSIDVQRSVEDNGNNGKYYKSSASVKVLGIPLNDVSVQSTADHPKLNNGEKKYEGGTLASGVYTGTMLNKSGSYNDAISITGNGVNTSEAVLVHPDVFTAKGETQSYSTQGKPYSLACQIMNFGNFDETINILNGLGINGGKAPDNNPSQSWCAGDQIKININAAEEN